VIAPMGEDCARDAALDRLVAKVRKGRRYRHIAPSLVRRIVVEELGKGRKPSEAVRETRRRLHQVAAVYLPDRIDYGNMLARLRRAKVAGERAFREECRQMMRLHASTRERLPILEQFWDACLAGLPPPRSIVDVGCGLNPLAIPWMPLPTGTAYHAVDVYEDLMAFLSAFLPLAGVSGRVEATDVLARPPAERYHLALALKLVPCAEQLDRGSAIRLLEALNARHVLVSYPVHSLGRCTRGMPETYERQFWTMVAGQDWDIRRLEFATEMVFVVDKAPESAQSASSSTTRKV